MRMELHVFEAAGRWHVVWVRPGMAPAPCGTGYPTEEAALVIAVAQDEAVAAVARKGWRKR